MSARRRDPTAYEDEGTVYHQDNFLDPPNGVSRNYPGDTTPFPRMFITL
jgi:hypothetical protein